MNLSITLERLINKDDLTNLKGGDMPVGCCGCSGGPGGNTFYGWMISGSIVDCIADCQAVFGSEATGSWWC